MPKCENKDLKRFINGGPGFCQSLLHQFPEPGSYGIFSAEKINGEIKNNIKNNRILFYIRFN